MALSDTQLLILSAASQRTDHSATLPANLRGSAAKKVIDRLLKQKLLQELRAKDDMPVWRRGEDNRPYTLRITKAGLKAIEVEHVSDASDDFSKPILMKSQPPMLPQIPIRANGAAPRDRPQRRSM